jgi:hypothetical protein
MRIACRLYLSLNKLVEWKALYFDLGPDFFVINERWSAAKPVRLVDRQHRGFGAFWTCSKQTLLDSELL